MKLLLKKLLLPHLLTYEELLSITTNVKATLNSMPMVS